MWWITSKIKTPFVSRCLFPVFAFTGGCTLLAHHQQSSSPRSDVVWCKSLDTPDYLLPYYLRSTRSRFNHFASIRKKGGARYMNKEDFVRALLVAKELADPKAAEELAPLFSVIDANGDGRLSYGEFSFLITLLSTNQRDVRLAFGMFDESNSGTITADQFGALIESFSDDSGGPPDCRNGITQKLFGTHFTKRCTLSDVELVVEDIRCEVWKAEFRQYDTSRRGSISTEEFGKLISSQMLGSHLPFFLVENLRAMKKESGEDETVPLQLWMSFSKILLRAQDIGEALEMYRTAGQPVRKPDLVRSVTALGQPPLSDAEVDLIFSLFDKNGDGSLEYEEFVSIMKNKVCYHARHQGKDTEKRNLLAQWFKCVGEQVY